MAVSTFADAGMTWLLHLSLQEKKKTNSEVAFGFA